MLVYASALTWGAGNIAACLKKFPLYLNQSEPLTGDLHTFQAWQESSFGKGGRSQSHSAFSAEQMANITTI